MSASPPVAGCTPPGLRRASMLCDDQNWKSPPRTQQNNTLCNTPATPITCDYDSTSPYISPDSDYADRHIARYTNRMCVERVCWAELEERSMPGLFAFALPDTNTICRRGEGERLAAAVNTWRRIMFARWKVFIFLLSVLSLLARLWRLLKDNFKKRVHRDNFFTAWQPRVDRRAVRLHVPFLYHRMRSQ